MYDVTKLVSQRIWKPLLDMLPTPRQKQFGRKRVKKNGLLYGILQILVNGVAWRKIADCGCSYASCFRYFKELEPRGKLKLIYKTLAKAKTDLTEGMIDTTTVDSFEFRHLTGWDGYKKKVGTKVSLFCDKHGLPADVVFGKGSFYDTEFFPQHIDNTRGIRKRLISLDMKYMSTALRRRMREKGIRINMKWRDQDFRRKRGPKFKLDSEKYHSRFLLERTNGWLKSFRGVRIRREYHPAMFKALVYFSHYHCSDKELEFCNGFGR